jgi:hypothetical protein
MSLLNAVHLVNAVHIVNALHGMKAVHLVNAVHRTPSVHGMNVVHTMNAVHTMNVVHVVTRGHTMNASHLVTSIDTSGPVLTWQDPPCHAHAHAGTTPPKGPHADRREVESLQTPNQKSNFQNSSLVRTGHR